MATSASNDEFVRVQSQWAESDSQHSSKADFYGRRKRTITFLRRKSNDVCHPLGNGLRQWWIRSSLNYDSAWRWVTWHIMKATRPFTAIVSWKPLSIVFKTKRRRNPPVNEQLRQCQSMVKPSFFCFKLIGSLLQRNRSTIDWNSSHILFRWCVRFTNMAIKNPR